MHRSCAAQSCATPCAARRRKRRSWWMKRERRSRRWWSRLKSHWSLRRNRNSSNHAPRDETLSLTLLVAIANPIHHAERDDYFPILSYNTPRVVNATPFGAEIGFHLSRRRPLVKRVFSAALILG